MKLRHWVLISNLFGFQVTPEKEFYLKRMIELDLKKFIKQLEEISENANKQHLLEKELYRISEKYDEFCFDVVSFRQSGMAELKRYLHY